MYGVNRHHPIRRCQFPPWKAALLPLYQFLVAKNREVHLEDDAATSELAREFRRTLMRIMITCDLDDERERLVDRFQARLSESPLPTLRVNEFGFIDFAAKLCSFLDAEHCHATPPFSFGDVVGALDGFLRPSDPVLLTPKRLKPATTSVSQQSAVLSAIPSAIHSAMLPPATPSSAATGRSIVKPTPLKFSTKDMSTAAETTHAALDPKLTAELKHSLWHTLDDSFFDTYFPAVSSEPQPPVFPAEPSEAEVVRWFRGYYDLCQMTMTATEKRGHRWAWNTSPTRALFHPESPKRKIDLFMASKRSARQSTTRGPAHWADVAVVGELKQQQGLNDISHDVIVQISNYVRETFGTQPGRRFVHAFSIINCKMRCWLFTRSGGVASRAFALDDPSGLSLFRRVFAGYLRMSRWDLGLANIDRKATVIGDKIFHLDPEPLWPARGIVTRGTTCWLAEPADELAAEDKPYVVKDSWRFSQRENEAIMLRDCQQAGVEGVVEYISHDISFEPETVHQIVGPAVLQAAMPLELQRTSKKRRNPEVSTSASKRIKSDTPSEAPLRRSSSRLRQKKTRTASMSQMASSLASSMPMSSPTPRKYSCPTSPITTSIPNRIHTRLVTSRGTRITECAPLTLLPAFRDAIRGHHSLLTRAHLLHRDISQNNIMATHPCAPRADGYAGFLIDLDHAQRLSCSASGAPERTGTYPFLSIEALEGGPEFLHTFYDDLQSFWFVFLYTCTPPEATAGWYLPAEDASGVKIALGLDDVRFDKLLGLFVDDDALRCAAREAREILWPHRRRIERARLKSVRESMYAGLVRAFDRALWMLAPEMALFREEWESE
ncbi:hypothetical protein FN846DRAFT_7012 [Sphaerosporella brunnea]|uniref:Fungal-type protein kinase domain-containing protein n=1 Tax=Sphaerosporella brunnea TaxID=1250544 RepID=A0A5J5FA92_9PEZI|nr:hypothetical protein FN846DRAFT_7012 [Sphaerosporella brunnea]